MSERAMTRRVDNTRYYEHPLTGAQLPSITTILSSMDKPALLPWAVKTTAQWAVDNVDTVSALAKSDPTAAVELLKGARWRVSNSAAGQGTSAHDIIENLATGRPVKVARSMNWAERAWRELTTEFDVEVVETEATVFNEQGGWAGSFDTLARVNGEMAMIDTKTGSGVWPEVALQTCAYAQGRVILREDGTEDPMPEVEKTYCFWVRPAGWALVPLRYDQAVYDAFRCLVRLHQWVAEDSRVAVGKPLNAKGLTRYRDKKFMDEQGGVA